MSLLFLVFSALMAIIAAWLVAWPLIRRAHTAPIVAQPVANLDIYQDQLAELEADRQNGVLSDEQYDAAKIELERRLLQDVETEVSVHAARAPARWPGFAIAIVVVLASALTYLALGKPEAIQAPMPALAGVDSHDDQLKQVEALLPKLVEHLQNEPTDATGWSMLGRSYMALERYPEAVRAFEHLTKLQPQEAQGYADLADATAMAQGQSLSGKPADYIALALKLDPDHGKARYLAGYAALESGKPKEAIQHWERLLSRLPAESEDAAVLRTQIAELKQQGGGPPAQISGQVRLSDAVRAQATPQDTVFVYARAVQGPKMPLAMLRAQVKDLPIQFSLDDSQAMSPQMKLSGFQQVVVVARVSKAGSAAPMSGDLEGMSAPVNLGTKNIVVEINRKID